KEWDDGEASHALITSLGEVMPGTSTDRVDLESDIVWTAVRAPDGTIYTGGVTDGTIYAVSGKTKRKLVELGKETPWIGALALGPTGTLYAGTVGTATIYAVDPRSGKATKLAKLEGAEHVWSLALDAGGKVLWAGTGPNGGLYAVDLAGGSA